MKGKPRIVCLGAGSAVFGLSNLATLVRSERLRGAELVLVDIDPRGLEVMTRLARMMNESWGGQKSIWSTTDRALALPGADFVVASVQVGPREDVWELDWQIPLRHGLRQPYAENGGPGAFAHTARNLPLMLAIARDMERLCPEAWLLNFTNPLIRLTWAVERYTRIKTVGLCHQLYWAYAMIGCVLADRWGIILPDDFHVHTDYDNAESLFTGILQSVPRMEIKAAGLNHFSWVVDVRDRETGEDLYPLLRERWFGGFRRNFEPLTREVFQAFGLMPTAGDAHLCEFLPWTHDPIKQPWEKYHLTPQNWAGNRRRRADMWAQANAIVNGQRSVDELRFAFSEGVVEMVEAILFDDNAYHQQLNLRNDGLIPNLPADALVEVPGYVGAQGPRGMPMPPLPEGIAELCRRELALSSLTIDACAKGDRALALQALLLDPMINDIDTAKAILEDFLREFAQYLPQFA